MNIRHDVRYAVRRLVKSPTFTIVAALSLGLGIGANSAVFSVVSAVLFRTFPAENPDRLVDVYMSEDNGFAYATASYLDYRDLREQNDVFEDVVGARAFFAQAGPRESPELVIGELVSGNYFTVLGVRPVHGRLFTEADDAQPGGHPVVVIGHDYFEGKLVGDPAAVGSEVRIAGRPYTVIGVLPPEFTGTFPGLVVDLWVPFMMTDAIVGPSSAGQLESRSSRSAFLKARLKDGVTARQAAASVDALSRTWQELYPESNQGRYLTAVPTNDVSINPAVDRFLAPAAVMILTVVGLVLLVACTNLASFLLARAADRRHEISVRLAIGATRGGLVRQLLVESVLLGLLGGVFGLMIAIWTLGALVRFQPPLPVSLNLDLALDVGVLTWTGLISVGAGLLFGLAPALQATRPDLSGSMKQATPPGRGRLPLRSALVVSQVAVSVLLLVGAGLFLRSLAAAQRIDPGFDTSPAAILWPNYEFSGYGPVEAKVLHAQIEERLTSLPGVESLGVADRLPLSMGVQTTDVSIPGVQPEGGRDAFELDHTWISASYLATMDVPIVQGRGFETSDSEDAERVAIVSETFASRFWPEGGAVGRVFDASGSSWRIVGVAADTKVRTIGEAYRPHLYRPLPQFGGGGFGVMFVVRGSGSAARLLETSRRAVRDIDPDLVVMEAKTMDEHLALLLFPPRIAAVLLSIFGALALALAGVGLYGIVTFAVSHRTREVGIRMSLGATGPSVVGLLVVGGMRLVGIGTMIGLALSVAGSLFMTRFLFGIRAVDPATFVAVPLVLASVALLAAYLPARRASRINPVEALKSG